MESSVGVDGSQQGGADSTHRYGPRTGYERRGPTVLRSRTPGVATRINRFINRRADLHSRQPEQPGVLHPLHSEQQPSEVRSGHECMRERPRNPHAPGLGLGFGLELGVRVRVRVRLLIHLG